MSTLRMPNINQVALSGRLVQDPELRFMDNGSARLRGRIAVNRSYRDRNDEWQEETSFFDIVLWQKAAETFAERLHKGTPVLPRVACKAIPGATARSRPTPGSKSRCAICKFWRKTRSPPTAKTSKPKPPLRRPEAPQV